MSKPTFERRILLAALPETVSSFFTNSERFARWWGAGSRVDARPGGEMHIQHPNGIVVSGTFRSAESEREFAFGYGYEDGKGPLPPDSTTVEVRLEAVPEGTRLQLRHEFPDEAARDSHAGGWRYHLSVLAVLAGEAQHPDPGGLMDRFLAAQQVEGQDARCQALRAMVTPDFRFRDTMACLEGAEELAAHLEAARAHGASFAIERDGPVRYCQGHAIGDWVVKHADGSTLLTGSNLMRLSPDGRIAEVTGLWEMPDPA